MSPKIEKIYNRIKKLTKEQKKIISLSAMVLVFLLIFWIFIYAPQARSFTAIKQELKQAEAQIAEIMSMTAGKELTQAFKDLKTDLVKISGKLPSGEEAVIYNLSESARKLGIEVKNIIPSGKRLLENRVSGYDIEELPISMNLSSDYRAMGEYLNMLRNRFPVLVKVRQLDIKGKGEGRTDLDVALQILAYLSREKE